jgi:pyruvate kinase
LEKPSAITALEEIIAISDGVMVARGDLGVEMPPEDVPGLQKLIVRTARKHGKPVIVATQMLESMITAPTPTRAEASDVATAIYDGADAVMLSAETASGDYPLEAVAIMDKIAQKTHNDPIYRTNNRAYHPDLQSTAADAITAAARQVADTVAAVAIVTYTTSGSTTYRAARERPDVPILALVSNPEVARQLSLCFGVHAVCAPDVKQFAEVVQQAVTIAQHDGLAKVGERLVITAGVPFGTPGTTNVLRIATVGETTATA